jgi:hypothetical protein
MTSYYEHEDELPDSTEAENTVSILAKRLLACQGLCCMKLVVYTAATIFVSITTGQEILKL